MADILTQCAKTFEEALKEYEALEPYHPEMRPIKDERQEKEWYLDLRSDELNFTAKYLIRLRKPAELVYFNVTEIELRKRVYGRPARSRHYDNFLAAIPLAKNTTDKMQEYSRTFLNKIVNTLHKFEQKTRAADSHD